MKDKFVNICKEKSFKTKVFIKNIVRTQAAVFVKFNYYSAATLLA